MRMSVGVNDEITSGKTWCQENTNREGESSECLHHDDINAFCIWWCHQTETFSALLALCEGNPPVTGGFPSQLPVMSFNVYSLICVWPNGWETNLNTGSSRCCHAHYDITVMITSPGCVSDRNHQSPVDPLHNGLAMQNVDVFSIKCFSVQCENLTIKISSCEDKWLSINSFHILYWQNLYWNRFFGLFLHDWN